ncbi:MBL fold metallo-hydrolase [Actinokineospora auranticolor]|uniref:Glyoxylase-like metal-dependent hydrolase (Beta-lactamase superfamily II) n=1 Tax=Actinokineospora auranticolor TaxID=155976 RepID=A0A2S6GQD8_9PSEU|nr:MBL fold metallo-hydrolase [Actinokineospora auranticolor]PPK67397.1 glyoxylase-like metal-dependent hydrolase (beta-lactamase superfamily II) [Actinokineospora auranticolor]
MLVVGFPTGAFQANCFIVAPGAGAQCVIVDPGQDAAEPIAEALREHRLSPVAVVLTHGHLDHTFSVTPVCDGDDVPAWIHPDDRHLLSDPLRGLSPEAGRYFGDLTMREPREVRELSDGAELDLAGLTLTVDHTPGHTEGSVSFRHTTEEGGQLLFSGDTLFAGSIGRTDLPGGSMARMTQSLRRLLTLDDETVVLPGHGPTTTIGRERASNPFLTGVAEPGAGHLGRGRGI